jgi:hypothetical protein
MYYGIRTKGRVEGYMLAKFEFLFMCTKSRYRILQERSERNYHSDGISYHLPSPLDTSNLTFFVTCSVFPYSYVHGSDTTVI